MGIEAVYIFCFVVGAVYALVAGVAAGVFGGHTRHAELMSHDLGHDINHGADPTHPAAQGEVHLSPVSPVTITMLVTAFGGVGLIAIHALALPILLRLRGGCSRLSIKVRWPIWMAVVVGKSGDLGEGYPHSGELWKFAFLEKGHTLRLDPRRWHPAQ
jgi:hypothetical protein